MKMVVDNHFLGRYDFLWVIVAGYFLYILYNCHIQNILYIIY